MIEINNLTKRFDDVLAVDDVTAVIKEQSVFGLVGTNGAGKSTTLRMIAGILHPDSGSILVDGKPVFENPEAKKDIFYISDDRYFYLNDTPEDMQNFYRGIYDGFDSERFYKLLDGFNLSKDRKVRTFSKGMKKQLLVALALSSNVKYILCDETFDGLDPMMRQAVKSLFASDIRERGITPIIASHNLRELEDICDHVGLLHKGGILFSRDLDDMKLGIHKVQCVLSEGVSEESFDTLDVALKKKFGSVYTLTVRGNEEEILEKLRGMETIFFEIVPLSLEEIFISETEVKGYDIKKLLDMEEQS